jgi:CheY-like chemotaxis protein/anti-sigma regulatory factor (Ser/Thr protein kinase)
LDFIDRELRRLDAPGLETSQAELVEAVAEARQGISRVATIVRDLKTFARDDLQELGTIDVRAALDATIRIAENEIRHRARLVREYPEHATIVRANEARLVQVFLNLLVNAAQAIPTGHASEHHISVTVTKVSEQVRVTVSDTGVGMSPEVLERALDPFFTTKPVGVGTGLGLGVCNNVVRALGGTLEIASQLGVGTEVTVSLPATDASEAAEPKNGQSPALVHDALRVLLIDDDPLVIRALRRLLRRHEVTSVERGREAISLIDQGREFDVILCELMMPELTGADVYQQVASLGRGAERNFVFLTGGVFTDHLRRFLETVPNPRFEKPIRADHLERILSANGATPKRRYDA